METTIKYPCRGCKYFSECGDNERTHPCDGRVITEGKNIKNAQKGIKTFDVYVKSITGLNDKTQVCAANEKEATEIVEDLIRNNELFDGKINNPLLCIVKLNHVYNEDDACFYAENGEYYEAP